MDTDYSLHISAVNYLNARPLIAGIQASTLGQQHRLSLDTPAEAARKVLSGEADIGLVPVATAKQLCSQAGGYHIVSQYGIGCHGPVATVCVFSQVPLHRIERLYLDYQSRSSVALVQYLMQQYWCHRPIYLQGFPGFEQTIEGATAALVIGDRAIQMLGKYPYAYDLGEAWHRLTGMPFVFAAWLSRERMPLSFVRAFDAAQAGGLARIPALASQEQAAYHPSFSVEEYYTTHIQYRLTALHRRAMLRFLSLL